jgi:hypothetical protein
LVQHIIEEAKINERNTDTYVETLKEDSTQLLKANSLRTLYMDHTETLEMYFKDHISKLKQIFEYYACLGENTNKTKLKSIKFAKFLRDCKLLKTISEKGERYPLSQSTVDIIFSQVTSQKSKNSSIMKVNEQISSDMNFGQFLLGIKEVAIKLYNEKPIEESINLLVCNNILKLDFELISEQQLKNRFLMEALEIMKDEAMVSFLSETHFDYNAQIAFSSLRLLL